MLFSPLEQFNILSFYDLVIFGSSDKILATFLISIWSVCPTTNIISFSATSDAIDISFMLDIINNLAWIYITTLSNLWTIYASNNASTGTLENFYAFSMNINIDLLCTKIGCALVSAYLIILEIWYATGNVVYNNIILYILTLSTKDLSYLIFSLNVSTIWQTMVFFFISFLFLTITWKDSLKLISKNTWQSIMELFYHIIFGVVYENAGSKALRFFPLIFTTFIIILTCNVLGMIPYSFTVTSHLIVTFSAALAIFTGINILGISLHRKHFLSLFFPPGAPIALAPLLVLIEFVSYVFRVLSLSIRLFANLMSGHTLLKILASFSWGVVSLWGIFLLPVTIIFIVTGLEMAIAFLQAYIFCVLLCIYLNDAFNLH